MQSWSTILNNNSGYEEPNNSVLGQSGNGPEFPPKTLFFVSANLTIRSIYDIKYIKQQNGNFSNNLTRANKDIKVYNELLNACLFCGIIFLLYYCNKACIWTVLTKIRRRWKFISCVILGSLSQPRIYAHWRYFYKNKLYFIDLIFVNSVRNTEIYEQKIRISANKWQLSDKCSSLQFSPDTDEITDSFVKQIFIIKNTCSRFFRWYI